jgi:hypothetical protein
MLTETQSRKRVMKMNAVAKALINKVRAERLQIGLPGLDAQPARIRQLEQRAGKFHSVAKALNLKHEKEFGLCHH